LFPRATAFNHSCDPNCEFYNLGARLSVRTLRRVASGDALHVSYVPVSDSRACRRGALASQFCFRCACSRCGDGRQEEEEEEEADRQEAVKAEVDRPEAVNCQEVEGRQAVEEVVQAGDTQEAVRPVAAVDAVRVSTAADEHSREVCGGAERLQPMRAASDSGGRAEG